MSKDTFSISLPISCKKIISAQATNFRKGSASGLASAYVFLDDSEPNSVIVAYDDSEGAHPWCPVLAWFICI